MSNENELLEPLATEAGQQAIARAINNLSSLEYAVRAERAATTATQKADEALNSADDASDYATEARNWATKTDGYVAQETITIPPEQEGDDPTTETIDLYSARYYAALAQDIYNNLQFDTEPTDDSTNLLSSGAIYDALDLKADKSTTYTKTEVDTQISTAVSNLVNSAPSTLDTLEELADALGDDPNFATTIATQLGLKADKSDTYTKTEVDTALSNVQSTLTFDNVPTANSDNPVKSSGIKTALDGKQDNLTFDSTPTANSNNPVTSGGIYTALQNVNIDIDDEITEDSDNPVTSAAIYEALANLPSGGGSGEYITGDAGDKLLENKQPGKAQWTTYQTGINLNNYDLIKVIGKSSVDDSLVFNTIFTLNEVGSFYNGNHYKTVGTFETIPINVYFGANSVSLSFNGSPTDTVNCYVYGIKFTKVLSEQMYSNVLYENSSGWKSGTLTLNDDWNNYDFIQIYLYTGNNSHGRGIETISKENLQYVKDKNSYYTLHIYNNGESIKFGLVDYNKFQTASTGVIYIDRIVGYKMAKGGYSGIVSDARMTVKSGVVDWGETLQGDAYRSVTFDSPMPDTNYIVLTSREFGGGEWAVAEISIKDKTVNGFTLWAYSPSRTANNPVFRWIAIRPNSYTREGMVEDVLFSNASGVNSGIINLSGNISDYDLICFGLVQNGGGSSYNQYDDYILTSNRVMEHTSANNTELIITTHTNFYVGFRYVTDTQLNITGYRNSKLVKITGIKFGKYVSGVAVDTTITSSGSGVPSTSAVYSALQNVSPALTIDSTPTSGSNNPVSSGGVYTALSNKQDTLTLDDNPTYNSNNLVKSNGIYTALYNISRGERFPYDAFSDRVPNDMKIDAADTVLYKQSGRTYYKKYGGVAAGCIAVIGVNRHALLVSDNEDAVKCYSSYETSYISPASTITVDNKIYYYAASTYGWDTGNTNNRTDKSIREISNTFSSNQEFAVYIINNLLLTVSPNRTLSEYKITDAYTKTEVDTLIQNVSGGSSVTVDSSITQNGTNPVESGAIYTALAGKQNTLTIDSSVTQSSTNPVQGGAVYTALGNKADSSTTLSGYGITDAYTKTEVDTALSNKGDVTTNTDQNITGTKTFVGSKKVGFKQSTANDKLGFTLYGNTGTERGYLEFNPTNTVDGVTGLMTLGNYATSAAALTQVGFRRYSNISGASGAYNLLMPMVADARTPFSLTTTYQNFYLPLGFTDGTTTVRTAKSGVVDLSPLLASLETRIAALEGN